MVPEQVRLDLAQECFRDQSLDGPSPWLPIPVKGGGSSGSARAPLQRDRACIAGETHHGQQA